MLRFKKFCFSIILILIAWGFAELLALAAHPWILDRPFSRATFENALLAAALDPRRVHDPAPSAASEWTVAPEILHPYVGFMPDPEQYPEPFDLGFPLGKSANPLRRRSPDTILVAIFGGSFADGIYASGDALVASFQPLDRRVVLFNFAYGGYKQPQALATLAYLLVLGAEFDVVVNVDGFNEVALTPVENTRHGVAPFYPRQWHRRVLDAPDPARTRLVGKLGVLREERAGWATSFLEHGLRHSPLLALVWAARDQTFRRRIAALQKRIEAPSTGPLPFAASGPVHPAWSGKNLYREITQVWTRSSLQMHALCQGNGIAYFHFLQPNQYVEGAKPMSEVERRIAFDPEHPYRQGVISGYPLLRKAGEDLLRAGVAFTDLTLVFQDRPEPLYGDTCCHLSRAGYDRVAARMALTMRALLPGRLLPGTARQSGQEH